MDIEFSPPNLKLVAPKNIAMHVDTEKEVINCP